ncbi:hypothetical protein TNCV_25401 [Trichonephila clavipes]|uniref:Uncharacterized protein n=1 Tax=Trichonephila clavipes TaxID=2585209 RepID=A0A8X7BC83_TRICX|nr:hypothetical protein TNCV_25401 [Trichonephila clavipes]
MASNLVWRKLMTWKVRLREKKFGSEHPLRGIYSPVVACQTVNQHYQNNLLGGVVGLGLVFTQSCGFDFGPRTVPLTRHPDRGRNFVSEEGIADVIVVGSQKTSVGTHITGNGVLISVFLKFAAIGDKVASLIALREEVIKASRKEAEREIEKKRQEAIRCRSSILVSRTQ